MDNELVEKLLYSTITTIENYVVPSLDTDLSKTMLDLSLRNLHLLHCYFGNRKEELEKLVNSLEGLIAKAQSLTNESVKPEQCTGVETDSLTELDKLDHRYNVLCNEISHYIPRLVHYSVSEESCAKEASALLQELIDSHEGFLATQAPDILNDIGVVYRGGRIDRTEKQEVNAEGGDITAESLTAYLKNKFPENTDIYADCVNVLPGGFSKITILFDLHKSVNEIQKCVIRKDLPIKFLGKSVVDEHPLLKRMFSDGFTVAEPLWLEKDTSIFNGAFLVSRAAAGSSDITKWSGDAEKNSQVSLELAHMMAQLHNDTPSTLGFSENVAERTAGDAMEEELQYWKDLYNKRRKQNYPLIEIVVEWLTQNIPQELYSRPARIIHGDIGFHNLMVDDGKVTALLDWEFSHLGDPTEDIAYVRQFVEKISDWNSFYQHYLDAGGLTISGECEDYFKIWQIARNPICQIDAGYLFENHFPGEIKLASSGMVFRHYLELHACKTLMKVINGQSS